MSDDDEKVYKVDTVPPPAGEDDAYGAPTKVGPMAMAIQELVLAAEKEAVARERASAQPAPPSQKPASVKIAPLPVPAPESSPPPSGKRIEVVAIDEAQKIEIAETSTDEALGQRDSDRWLPVASPEPPRAEYAAEPLPVHSPASDDDDDAETKLSPNAKPFASPLVVSPAAGGGVRRDTLLIAALVLLGLAIVLYVVVRRQ